MSLQGSSLLDLDVRGRRWERRLALACLCIASIVPWALDLPIALAALACAASVAAVTQGLRRAGWLGVAARLQRVVWLADGRWLLTDGRGRCWDGMLRAGSRVGAGHVWLQWDADRRRSMLLAGNDLPWLQMRRLCARLRLEGQREVGKRVSNQDFVT